MKNQRSLDECRGSVSSVGFPRHSLGLSSQGNWNKSVQRPIPGSWLEARSWDGASKLTTLNKIVYCCLGLWLLGLKKLEKFESTLIPGVKSSHLLS